MAGIWLDVFPSGVVDFEEVSAFLAAEVLTGFISQLAACDAAETEIRLAHSFDGSGDQGHGRDLLLSPQVLIGLINPVGARRSKDVEIDSVFQGQRLMRHVRRNTEHFSRVNDNFFAVDIELERALDDVGQLLVVMAVKRDNTSLLEQHAGQHDLLSNHKLALQERIEILQRNHVPGDVLQFDVDCCLLDLRTFRGPRFWSSAPGGRFRFLLRLCHVLPCRRMCQETPSRIRTSRFASPRTAIAFLYSGSSYAAMASCTLSNSTITERSCIPASYTFTAVPRERNRPPCALTTGVASLAYSVNTAGFLT